MLVSSLEEEGGHSVEVSQGEHKHQRLLAFAHTTKLGETAEQISKGLSTPFVLSQDIMCVKTGLVLLGGSSIFVEPLADCCRPELRAAVLVAFHMGIMRQSFCGTPLSAP